MSTPPDRHMILRPNRSMPPRSRKIFYGGLAAATTLANIFTAAAGIWPVGVFVSLACGGAAAGLAATVRSGNQREELRLTQSGFEIARYRPGARQADIVTFGRYMLEIVLTERTGEPDRLLLRAQGKTCEIGAFLPPDEKREIAQALTRWLEDAQTPCHIKRPALMPETVMS